MAPVGRPRKNRDLQIVPTIPVAPHDTQEQDNKESSIMSSIDEMINQKIEEKISRVNSEEIFQLVKELDKEISNKINKVNLRYLIHFMESGLNALKELEAVSNKETN